MLIKIFEALQLAADRIATFHHQQLPQNINYADSAGVSLGLTWNAIAQAGIYVPGRRASYPSSVLMN